jgi:hypothetical protein
MSTTDLSQPSLEPVATDARASVLRNDEAYAGVMQKGSDHPELEMPGSDALPFTSYRTDVSLPGEPVARWEAETVRRRRISTEVGP